MIRFVCKPEFT